MYVDVCFFWPAIVLMLLFRHITEGEDALHVVAFIIYIIVVQWATDVVFLYILLPQISSVNELAMRLHIVTANQRWVEGQAAAGGGGAGGGGRGSEREDASPSRDTMDQVVSMLGGGEVCALPLAAREANRYDTLHRIIAQPIRYTIASIYFTKKGARNQLLGVVGAVLFSFVRMIMSVVLDS